ncbi:MAG: aspartate carbamoyltransferase [Methylococcales bacterium]|nr:aspartate carbamoyltransferase [Methylococcales bacterium]MDP3840776.1 aspartate carbamoyltransferase [Methylococcales bacterium]
MKYSILLLTGLVLFSTAALTAEQVSPERTKEVQQRTQQVTPYSVDQTKQMFTKTVHGGVQHIIVNSADNTEQIKLVQAYLLKLTNDFSTGDFSVTEQIHGANMPGLAILKMAQPYDIKFKYKALPNGAEIHYSTEYPKYAQALHEWFDAQMKEHDNTVIPEHSQHHKTPAE